MQPESPPREPPLREQVRRRGPRRWRVLNRIATLTTMPRGIYAGLGSGALGVQEFRRFWFGMIVSNVGSWMQMIAQGWLILELTGSPFYLGLVGLVRAIPALSLTLIGGVLADRFDRRRLLLITQMSAAIVSLSLGALVLTGLVEIWHVLAMSFIASVVMAIDNPARHALVPALVGRENIASAVALNSAAWNGASIIGPSVAGVLVAIAGTGGAFVLNGLSFLAVFYAVLLMKPLEQRPRGSQTMLQNLTEGLRFILADRRIWGIMLIIAIPTFFGRPVIQLMPEFARTVLNTGPEGYGVLMAVTGFGALVGALSVSKLSASPIGQGRLLFFVTGIFAVSLLLFSGSSWFVPSLLILLVVGATPTILMGLANTLLQFSIKEEMRGRVMSAYVLVPMSLMPLGSMALGSLAAVIGVSLAFALGSVIILLATVIAYRLMPELREAR
jgi:MFS family permease